MIDSKEQYERPQPCGIRAWQVAIALTVFAAYVGWAWSSVLGGFGGDNAIYLLSAKYLSPFSDDPEVAAAFFKSSPYPPLYPLVLAITGGGHSLLAAHIATATCLVLALYMLYRWQRTLAFSRAEATAISVLVAIVPGVYLQSLEILSENLYLCLTLLALFSYERANESSGERWLGVAALAVASAVLTRTAGVALLAAFVVHLISKRRSQSVAFAILALSPPLLWHLLSKGGYGNLIGQPGGIEVSIAEIARVVATQGKMLALGWIVNMSQSAIVPLSIAIACIGVMCLMGLILRLLQWKLDALYAIFYIGILLLWPFPQESPRFVVVILPIMLVQGFMLLSNLPTLRFLGVRRPVAATLFLGVMFMIMIPQLVLNTMRFLEPVSGDASRFKRTPGWYDPNIGRAWSALRSSDALVTAMQTARRMVPSNECILSIKPSITAFYTGHMSKNPPASSTSDRQFREMIAGSGCRYAIMFASTTPTYNTRFYPYDRLKSQLEIMQLASVETTKAKYPVAVLARITAPLR